MAILDPQPPPGPNPYLAKLRTIGVISKRSGSTVKEGRRPDGVRVKATTDEAGNTVTEHAVKGDRRDVHIRNPTIVCAPRVTVPPTTRETHGGG